MSTDTPTTVRAPLFPEELARALTERKSQAREAVPEGTPIPAGSRQETLFSMGMAMRARGSTQQNINTTLRAENEARCTPPLNEQRMQNLVKGVMRSNMDAEPRWEATRIRHDESTGFEPVDWEDIWDKPYPEIDWVPEMEGIAIAGRASNVYGPAGVGKSELVLHRAVAAAKQGAKILWLDREMTELDTLDRLKEMGYTKEDVANLLYLVYPPFHMFDTVDGGEELEGVAQGFGADVVILDSLSKFVTDEEGTSHSHFYVNTVLPLRSAGRAIVLIDHAGKELSRGARGASQKKDNMDLFMEAARYAGVGTKLTTGKRRHSWVKDAYTYRRLTKPVLSYRLTNVCVWCKAQATTVGGPSSMPVCDKHA